MEALRAAYISDEMEEMEFPSISDIVHASLEAELERDLVSTVLKCQ